MQTNALFVTGTDTEVGKSVACGALLQAFAARGFTTAGFKPVSAGCEWDGRQWVNQDAALLQRQASLSLPLSQINPYAFEAPIAPHIAATQQGIHIDLGRLDEAFTQIRASGAEQLVVEGAGGWRLPLGGGRFLSDWVKRQRLPVVLVVGMRLGCLNHALLTVEAIRRDGLTLAGWIANRCVPEQACYAENLATLKELMQAPLLGELPFCESPEEAPLGDRLDVTPLLEHRLT